MNRTRITLLGAVLASLIVVAVAAAAKPGPGTSTGTGRVFAPNPVASQQDQTLTDRKDADYTELQGAYRIVTLTNLDGSGRLVGDWANVRSETGGAAYSPTNTFHYNRSQDEFEQVMAYYWVTQGQLYLQELGFGTTYGGVNNESQDIRINQWGADNSYSWDKHDVLRFGKGGVDDAEDADVILHEYGHAIHDAQGVDLQGVEGGGIGEGFGDYFALAVTQRYAPTADPACIADWDATSYDPTAPYCLRRTDTEASYPGDLSASVHRNGLIWSGALTDIRAAVGAARADTLIVQAHFSMGLVTTMAYAAERTVETAEQLYGAATAAQVREAFERRGIL